MRARFALVLLAALLAAPATAQATPSGARLTLEQALAVGPDASAAVSAARAALASAQRNDARVSSDPTSLRVDRISAHNQLASAQGELVAAQAANAVQVASAYVGALEADTTLAIAQLNAAIQLQTLQAQQTKQQAGAATDLEVAQARNSYQQAQAALADAQIQRTLAYNALASLLGREAPSLEAVTSAPALADLDSYLQDAAQNNAQLVAARGAATLAEAQYQATDNDFSSRSSIQQARDALDEAGRQVRETERTLELGVRAAYADARAASAALANARAADATAQSDLDSAKAQLDAGSISPLAYRNDELTRMQAAQTLETATHTFVLKAYQLQQVVAGS